MKRKDKIKDFKKMGKQELVRLLNDNKEKLRKLRFNLSAGKVKNVREVQSIRKDIARIMYFIHQK